ncbi:MAG: extracellular solute-binding protein [Ktedonobacteraceae bacterium]|nr:extracellular solute-binding protein [Ktedonobacteraceae bacterium]
MTTLYDASSSDNLMAETHIKRKDLTVNSERSSRSDIRGRPAIFTILAVSLLVLVTACGGGGTSGGSAGTPSGKITVTLWSWTPISSTTQKMIAEIEKKYPNIQIKASIQPHTAYNTALKAAAASNSLPNLIGLPAGSDTQEYRQYLLPLNPIAQEFWGANWQSNFPKIAIEQARLGNPPGDENFYMLPQETEVINLWYNKKIFNQLHLTPPKTLDQMVEAAQKIKAAGYIPFYQGGAQVNFVAWVYMQIAAQTDPTSLQAAAVQGKATWTSPGMIKAAQVWQTLFTKHVFQDNALSAQQYPTGANLFAAGKVGIISLGSWWLQQTKLENIPDGLRTMSDYGTFPFPAVTAGGQPTGPMGGIDFGWGLPKNANSSPAVLDASKKVLKELISGVGEQVAVNDLNDLPAFNGFKPQGQVDANVMALYNQFIEDLQQAQNHYIGNPTVQQALVSNLQAVGAGTLPPEQAMAKVQSVAQAQAGK